MNFVDREYREFVEVIQWDAEELFRHSFEVVVSDTDYEMATCYEGDRTCKYKVDRYFILAYRTPEPVRKIIRLQNKKAGFSLITSIQYPIHTNYNEDIGRIYIGRCPKIDELTGGESSIVQTIFIFSQQLTNETIDLDTSPFNIGVQHYPMCLSIGCPGQ